MNRHNTLYRAQNSRTEASFDESAALGILQHLEKDTLQELSDSEEKLKDLIQDETQIKNLEQEKEMLITSNKSLADYNLSMKPKLNQGKELLSLEYEKLEKLKEEYDTLMSQIASSSQSQSIEVAHALLQTKAAQSEEETDQLSEEYLDKAVDCDTFLDQYIEKRKQTHLLKLKSEKLGEMIQQNVNSGTWGGSNSPQRMPINAATHQPANAPYPMYGMGMPRPHMPPVSS